MLLCEGEVGESGGDGCRVGLHERLRGGGSGGLVGGRWGGEA